MANPAIDSVLHQLGDFGRYQMRVYLLSSLPIFIAGAITTALVFTTAIPNHRCFIEGCDLGSPWNDSDVIGLESYNETFLQFTVPKSSSSPTQFDNCHQNGRNLDQNLDLCLANLFDNNTQIGCDEYVFEHKYFENTIATEFNLVCSWSWTVQVLQSLFFIGILLGAILNGHIADRHGRQTVFVFISPLLLLTIFLSALSPNTFVYGLCLVVKGICVAGIYQSAFVIGIEFTGGRYRFWCGNISSIIFALGAIYACLVADYFRNWRFIEIALNFPVMIMLSYPCIFPESIRWQLSNGKLESAIRQIRKAARINQTVIPEESFAALISHVQSKVKDSNDNTTLIDLFRHQVVRLWTLALLFIWFANSLVYYGLSFLSSQVDDNIYFAMTMLSLVEVPGIILTAYAVEKFSRKKLLAAVMLAGGVACTIASVLPDSYLHLKMWLAILGKCNISGSFALIYVYTVEIFPTVLRISGLGLCSSLARIGGITAPHLLELTVFGSSFPFLVIGLISIVAGAVSSVLPETKGKRLPDTIEEVAMLQNGHSPYRQYDDRASALKMFAVEDEESNLLENEFD